MGKPAVVEVADSVFGISSSWLVALTEHNYVRSINPAFVALRDIYEETKNLTSEDMKEMMYNFPTYYSRWWNQLYKDAPIHIFIETGMVVFILWLVFIRKTADPKKGSKDVKFSKKEIDWLVKSWEPEPLVRD